MRHEEPIENFPLKGSVDAGITYSSRYSEIDACISANLDPHLWYCTDFYPYELKVIILAWYRVSHLIDTHVKDAMYRKALKDQKAAEARAKSKRK